MFFQVDGDNKAEAVLAPGVGGAEPVAKGAKRKRAVLDDPDEPPPPSARDKRDKGKGRASTLAADEEALWEAYPSSQIEPIPTQPSFNFSENGSRDTSMTSLSSETSLKSRDTKETVNELAEEIAKTGLPLYRKEATEGARIPDMILPSIEAGPSVPLSSSGYTIIAHDRRAQSLMDGLDIAWGTQYEIARGVTDGRWTWADVTTAKLNQLCGDNEDTAYRVPSVLVSNTEPSRDVTKRLWAELDLEQAAIVENEERGLGLKGEWHGQKNWYGGRIQQIVNMDWDSVSKSFALQLEKMQMTRSHRFARYLGSRRLLQVKLSGTKRNAALEREFLMQKFVLCGRVFVPFSSKDLKVYLLETDDNYEREPVPAQGDLYRRTFQDFIEWQNPMALNRNQPIAKWTTRFDLGLSTSIPALRFDPDAITIEEDICAPHSGSKVPPEKVFTDGCGFMNRAALVAIAKNLGYADVPTAVQGRIFGAKGLWALHPYDLTEAVKPRIWIRPSQIKVKLVDNISSLELHKVHAAHFIFDLVAPSQISLGTRLNRLTVVNLAHGGVPKKAFVDLMKASLDREVTPLTQWQGEGAMQVLWYAVNQTTRVSSTRLQQFVSGAQRALGHSRKRNAEDDIIDNSDTESGGSPGSILTKSLASGKPLSIAEGVLNLLLAGFNPTEEQFLYEELRLVVNGVVSESIKRCHILVPESADAFIIPDPYNVLQQDEIHFIASKDLRDRIEYSKPTIIEGDVLLYRNPSRLPSDVRKVKAVDCPALSRYRDVIVLPTKGPCSMASLLAGGDYDGDVAICIWNRQIVDAFNNSPVERMQDGFIEEYFEPESDIELVSSVADEIRSSPTHAQTILQRRLLSGITDSKVGIYSNFHENLVYARGYDHEETLRVAHMFNILLDARKSGHVVKDTVYKEDKIRYDRDHPPCMAEGDFADENPNYLHRDKGLPKFILDQLLVAGKKLSDGHLSKYENLGKHFQERRHLDPVILEVYNRYKAIPAFEAELQAVEKFVDHCRTKWQMIWLPKSPSKRAALRGKHNKKQTRQPEQQKIRALVAEYRQATMDAPILRETGALATVAASYAYKQGPRFAFNVAFEEIAGIKAKACRITPAKAEMVASMTVPSSFARVYAQMAAGTI
ncbi:hypothetical protein BDW22DRAFT_1350519 [Trametopsis cervina]|nr:hypothetical protein BDW22DRAFT_1350519 [Trametopsis cervina]